MAADESCGHTDAAPSRLRGTAFWLLGRTARTANALTRDRLVEAGLRYGFYGVLATLEEFGPAAQSTIGRRLGIDPSDMTAIATDLEGEGYVQRRRDLDDRRRNLVTITAAGRSALRRFDRAIAAAEEEFLGQLTAAERKHLVGILERISDRP